MLAEFALVVTTLTPWTIFPWSEHPELDDEPTVWPVQQLVIQ